MAELLTTYVGTSLSFVFERIQYWFISIFSSGGTIGPRTMNSESKPQQ